MTKLLALTQDFGVSRPIFALYLNDHGELEGSTRNPIYKYEPTPIEGDILSELVCECYYEDFDHRCSEFVIIRRDIASKAMAKIRAQTKDFVEKNSDMKSPRQGKLYRWIARSMPTNDEFNDTLIMLYLYWKPHTGTSMAGLRSSQKHIENTMAILTAMMEKHEQ